MAHRDALITIATALVALGSASDARAQAWVGGKGGLDLNLDYNLAISDKVIGESSDTEFPDSGTTTQQLTVGAEYIPIDRLAVSLALPVAFLKYTGNKTMYPHPGGGTYDDGSTHITLTDLRVGARYQVLEDPVALSPHLGVSIPVADYETIGNSVAGRHLKALHLGLGVGRQITDALYVHLVYEFSLVEKYDRTADTAKSGQNRSDLAFTVGYRLLDDRLDINLEANVHETHGGVAFDDFPSLTPDEVLYHDAILDEDIVLIGGGVGYQLTDTLSATLAARYFLTGQNTQNASILGLGLAWTAL